MNLPIATSNGLHGIRTVPGDKSISHRALMIGSLAEGTTTIRGLSTAADVRSTFGCLISLGVAIEDDGHECIIHGRGPRGFKKPSNPLDAGNSGTTMRLLSGILSGQRFDSVVVGDASLSKRPMKRVIEPLQMMGADISGTPEFTAPLRIGPTYNLRPIEYELKVPSAQVKSAILLAGLYADGITRVIESTPTRDHTERMLGLKVSTTGVKRSIEVRGGQKIPHGLIHVPGDISAATFLIAAASIVPNSEITIKNVGLNKTRSAILDVYRRMNAHITVVNEKIEAGEEVGDIEVRFAKLRSDFQLRGEEVAALIDEIPMLAVTAAFAEGSIEIRDADELRHKECDRIKAVVHNLRLLGLHVQEFPDGFAFESKKGLIGRELETFGDHRIAMAFGVAGLCVEGVRIKDPECVNISFPGFWQTLNN